MSNFVFIFHIRLCDMYTRIFVDSWIISFFEFWPITVFIALLNPTKTNLEGFRLKCDSSPTKPFSDTTLRWNWRFWQNFDQPNQLEKDITKKLDDMVTEMVKKLVEFCRDFTDGTRFKFTPGGMVLRFYERALDFAQKIKVLVRCPNTLTSTRYLKIFANMWKICTFADMLFQQDNVSKRTATSVRSFFRLKTMGNPQLVTLESKLEYYRELSGLL